MTTDGERPSAADPGRGYVLDIEDICAILPHRQPMLLIDRVLELEPGKRAVGLKNVTINEPFFAGHFPGQAIMPGVMIVEAMAQTAAIMMLTIPSYDGRLAFMVTLDRVKLRRAVVPGDTLIMETISLRTRGSSGKVRMTARVEGKLVAEAEMVFALREWRQDTSANGDRGDGGIRSVTGAAVGGEYA